MWLSRVYVIYNGEYLNMIHLRDKKQKDEMMLLW